jgi:Zn ribbon nucleic-acid-binding protein
MTVPNQRSADQEPAGRVAVPTLVWGHRVGVSLIENFGIPFYGYNVVEGLSWDCPRCNTSGAVELRYRKRMYSYRCTNCGWKQNYNHILAQQMLTELGVPLRP